MSVFKCFVYLQGHDRNRKITAKDELGDVRVMKNLR